MFERASEGEDQGGSCEDDWEPEEEEEKVNVDQVPVKAEVLEVWEPEEEEGPQAAATTTTTKQEENDDCSSDSSDDVVQLSGSWSSRCLLFFCFLPVCLLMGPSGPPLQVVMVAQMVTIGSSGSLITLVMRASDGPPMAPGGAQNFSLLARRQCTFSSSPPVPPPFSLSLCTGRINCGMLATVELDVNEIASC